MQQRMEHQSRQSRQGKKEEISPQAATFFPKGAIAFFGAMLILFALIWLGIYVVLVQREFWP